MSRTTGSKDLKPRIRKPRSTWKVGNDVGRVKSLRSYQQSQIDMLISRILSNVFWAMVGFIVAYFLF